MLTPILLLTSLGFAAWYPLCFWLSRGDPLKNNFPRFHLGLPVFIGGALAVWLCFLPLPVAAKIAVWVWVLTLAFVAARYWNTDTPHLTLLTIPCIIGIMATVAIQAAYMPVTLPIVIAIFLGSAILAAATYAMNLGHWYLNVLGLPIAHLIRATQVFWALVIMRALFNGIQLVTATITLDWQPQPVWQFLWSMEGFGLFIGIFFGTLFPLIANYFVMGTLKVKSTQSATGILYVILCAVLIGELSYRYYLVKYGIAM